MATVIISENLVPELITRFSHRNYTVVSKVCDFCDKELDKNYESQQCFICPTLYDECPDCKIKNNYSRRTCHKDHTVNNTVIPPDQLAILEKEITLFTAIGLSYSERQRLFDSYDDDDYPPSEIDVTKALKSELIKVQKELPEICKIASADHVKIYLGNTECGSMYVRLSLT